MSGPYARRPVLVAAVVLLAGLPVPGAEYRFATEMGGPYRGVGYDREHDAVVVATQGAVYLVPVSQGSGEGSGPRRIGLQGIEEGMQVLPCRAGGILLGFRGGEDGFDALIVSTVTGERLARIVPRDRGAFRSVLAGGPGRTLATISERPAETESAGRLWRWDLWSAEGEHLSAWTTPAGVKAGFDPKGERLLLVLEDRAEIRDRVGRPVGQPVAGAFHKAALSEGGRVLILGEYRDRRAITLVVDGTSRRMVADAAVHGVDVAPDGRSAWAWFQAGRIHPIDLQTGVLGAAVPLRFGSEEVSVTSFVAENSGAALVAFATRPQGAGAYNGGRIARVTRGGVEWQKPFPTSVPTAFLPAAIRAGSAIAAWNRERLAVLDPRSPGGSGNGQ